MRQKPFLISAGQVKHHLMSIDRTTRQLWQCFCRQVLCENRMCSAYVGWQRSSSCEWSMGTRDLTPIKTAVEPAISVKPAVWTQAAALSYSPYPVTNLNISSYLEVLHRNHPGIVSLSFVAFDFDGASFLWYYTMSDFCKPIFRFGQRQLEPGMRTVFAVKIDPSLQFKNKT